MRTALFFNKTRFNVIRILAVILFVLPLLVTCTSGSKKNDVKQQAPPDARKTETVQTPRPSPTTQTTQGDGRSLLGQPAQTPRPSPTAQATTETRKPDAQTGGIQPWQYEKAIKEPLKVTPGAQTVTVGNLATNQVQILIPPGTVPTGTTVTISNPDSVPQVNTARITPVGTPVRISIGDDKPVRLSQLITVTLKFDPKTLPPGTNAGNLWAVFYAPGLNDWELFRPNKVDLQAGTLTFTTGHLTVTGAAKVGVDALIEQWLGSSTAADIAQTSLADERVNKLYEQAVDDLLKDHLGLDEKQWKSKILSSLAKDEEWGQIAKQARDIYITGTGQNAEKKRVNEEDVTKLVQTINGFVAKKMVENIDEGTLEKALKKISGEDDDASKGLEKTVGWAGAAAEAAGYLAEKDYIGAAKIIGSKWTNDDPVGKVLTKTVKATAAAINFGIDVWKNAEVDAAYKAWKNGASTRTAYGYEVDKGKFDDVWNQMRGLDTWLQNQAVATEYAVRQENDNYDKMSAREEQMLRDKAKSNLQSMFEARAKAEAAEAARKAELKEVLDAVKDKGMLDRSTFYFPNDDVELRINLIMHLRNKILRDAAGKKVSVKDIAELAEWWFTYPAGPNRDEKYAEEMLKRFGIDLNAQTAKMDPQQLVGEPNKDYVFKVVTTKPMEKARYDWTLNGKQIQSGASNNVKVNFPADGKYNVSVRLFDGSGREQIKALARANIKKASQQQVPGLQQGAVEGQIKSSDASKLFGTTDNPVTVRFSGAIKSSPGKDPALKFEGVEFYSRYGPKKDVLAFVFSTPVKRSDPLGLDRAKMEFVSPTKSEVKKSKSIETPWLTGNTPPPPTIVTTTFTFTGWGKDKSDGMAYSDADHSEVGYSWLNATPISCISCLHLDLKRAGEGNDDAGGVFFDLNLTYEEKTGTVSITKKEQKTVVIRLVNR